MRHFLIIVCFLIVKLSFADFQWNKNCKEAYKLTIELKFDKAQTILENEKKENPNNSLTHFIENYTNYLKIQIGEEKSDFDKLKINKDKYLDIIEEDNSESPWLLYSQAEINLQWAANRLKFGEYFSAAFEINKAYRLLQENSKKYPYFIPNKKSLGLLYTLIGSVPEQYNWILSIIGMEGSIKSGFKLIEESILEMKKNNDFSIMLDESYFLYSFLKMNLDNNTSDLKKILKQIQTSDNLLLNFASSRLASKLGENDLAIQILEKRNSDKSCYPFHYLEYLLGVSKQNKLDDECLTHFENYLKNFNGKNYKKSALMRMSWHYLLKNDIKNFKLFRDKISNIGSNQIDADKEAISYFEYKEIPQKNLLKARLLFDGGYYNLAIAELNKIDNPQQFSNSKNTLEFYYRLARCQENTQQNNNAISNYKKTIRIGYNERYFYAAKSALQLALHYESDGQKSEAKSFFNTCIEMKNHQHEQGIEQKAKAGLNRLN